MRISVIEDFKWIPFVVEYKWIPFVASPPGSDPGPKRNNKKQKTLKPLKMAEIIRLSIIFNDLSVKNIKTQHFPPPGSPNHMKTQHFPPPVC